MAERGRNPFTQSARGARLLSALQLPLFLSWPPNGYGVITTTGRTTGKPRRRCVRVVRAGDHAYLVAIKGAHVGWLRNLLVTPRVDLRIRGGRFTGRARVLDDVPGRSAARDIYCGAPSYFEYLECLMWRTGRPTRQAIDGLHGEWFDHGVVVVIDLDT